MTIFLIDLLGNPIRCEITNRALRAPNGKRFKDYAEKNSECRGYVRADVLLGDEVISEGILVSNTMDGVVIEWNPELLLPYVVAEGYEDIVPKHTTHFSINRYSIEVGIVLIGVWSGDVIECILESMLCMDVHLNQIFVLFVLLQIKYNHRL